MVPMDIPSSVNAPVAVTVKVAPMPLAPLEYVPVREAVEAARTATAGLTAAMGFVIAVRTKLSVAASALLSPAVCVVAVTPLGSAVAGTQTLFDPVYVHTCPEVAFEVWVTTFAAGMLLSAIWPPVPVNSVRSRVVTPEAGPVVIPAPEPANASEEVTVVAVAAMGTCPAVIPDRPLLPPEIVLQPKAPVAAVKIIAFEAP